MIPGGLYFRNLRLEEIQKWKGLSFRTNTSTPVLKRLMNMKYLALKVDGRCRKSQIAFHWLLNLEL